MKMSSGDHYVAKVQRDNITYKYILNIVYQCLNYRYVEQKVKIRDGNFTRMA